MATFKIVQGGVYANAKEVFAREVVEIASDGYVFYNDYGLSDGAPIGRHRKCSLGAFTQWVARLLTPEEIRKLDRDRGIIREIAQGLAMIQVAVEAASDDLIRREFYRRGLDRVAAPDQPPKPVEETQDFPGVC